MRIMFTIFTVALTLLLPVAAFAQKGSGGPAAHCDTPVEPATPDGTTATMETMVAAQQVMKAFLADGDAYLECLKSAEATFAEEITEEHQASLVASHNGMVEAIEGVANKFNEAVRAYKARQ